jgi:hypothetical protein
MIVYGVKESMKIFESGAIETLICYEWLPHVRLVLRNKVSGIS